MSKLIRFEKLKINRSRRLGISAKTLTYLSPVDFSFFLFKLDAPFYQ